MENKCECECESEGCECGCPTSAGGHHGYGQGRSGFQALDPVTIAQTMFQKAFFKALFEVKVEKLKKKIEEKWGSNLDQAADAVIHAYGKEWEALGSTAHAKQELHNKLASILTQKKK
jgi:hypothetical protein